MEKMRSLGGLSLVTTHTQLIDSKRRVDAIADAARAARDFGDVWLARTSEIAEWWLARSELKLTVRERGDRSAFLNVRNNGASAVESAWLHVHLPEDVTTFAAPELGDIILESHYEAGGLHVRLPTVGPGESLEILLPRESQVYYQYVDENGMVRFTENPYDVPEAWRGRAGRVELDVAPPDTPAAARLVRKLRATPDVGNADF